MGRWVSGEQGDVLPHHWVWGEESRLWGGGGGTEFKFLGVNAKPGALVQVEVLTMCSVCRRVMGLFL